MQKFGISYQLVNKFAFPFSVPPESKAIKEYALTGRKEGRIRIQFKANPKPTKGYWHIDNGSNAKMVQVGTMSGDRKYISSSFLQSKVVIFHM